MDSRPDRTRPDQARPDQPQPDQTSPDHAERDEVAQDRAGQAGAGDDHTEHDHTEHDHGPTPDAGVRAARDGDLAELGRVQAQVWRAAYAEVLPPSVLAGLTAEPFEAAWRTSLRRPPSTRHRLLVGTAAGRVVGLAAVGPSGDPDADPAAAELLVLAVDPASRRDGHGSRLLNAAVDIMRENGFQTVRVWLSALDEHTRAFLQGSGLEPDGAYRDRVVGPDAQTLREVRLVAALPAP